MNREAAQQCIQRARSHMSAGRLDDALRFAKKAANMKDTDVHQAETLIKIIQEKQKKAASGSDGAQASSTAPTSGAAAADGMRYRRTAFRAEEKTTTTTYREQRQAPPSRPFTAEQAAAVRQVLQSKNLYDRLGVDRRADAKTMKRAFRKLALRLHPDKNPAPKADQAFKAVNKAYEILSDDQKRRHYDMTGQETPSRPTMRAEDIFANMHDNPFEFFFAGGPGFRVYRNGFNGGGGGGFRQRQRQRQQHEHEAARDREAQRMNMLGYMGMFMIFMVLMGAFSSDHAPSPYSFTRSKIHHIARRTSTDPPISYYVASDFASTYLGSSREHRTRLHHLEQRIFRDYYHHMETKCYQEREMKAYRIREVRRRRLGDDELEKARNAATPSCDVLKKLLETHGV
ncbi:hypothetical protein PTSG_10855 [Salpingoeca rosetta]|uniref:J domain-containing protein n=1 Tax=Salpingoeca rosetta (strain ATCC 50818 / BSB-021) TaxID=946362 RepID=F2URK5_SALR5|nr:uncharacterized protein PTSG_10855 [Salpingoeca rosetta]EGD80174.1 hypothetical protein PTSG_10855 [Salpingoeca rosetta]|eukprot:XP_004988236.1 hypothetical protein PTSG_10855 [Salpingoeca rosetta]